MTGWEKQKELVQYRMQQAEESLDEARFLLGGGKSARSVINRAYYAMFYSVLALLVYEEVSSSKHSGVLSYFNRHFVKGGIFDKSLGCGWARLSNCGSAWITANRSSRPGNRRRRFSIRRSASYERWRRTWRRPARYEACSR